MIVCKLCLSQDSAQFYNIHYGVPTIKQKLRLCQPELDDNFLEGAVICDHCLANVYISYDFKKKCLATMESNKTAKLDGNNEVNIENMEYKEVKASRKLKIINLDNDEDRKQLMAAVNNDDNKTQAAVVPRCRPKPKNQRKRLRIVCKICLKHFLTISQLRNHTALFHKTNTVQKRLPLILATLPMETLNKINCELKEICVPVNCNNCKIKLKCAHELKYHRTLHHSHINLNPIHFNVTCQMCAMSFSHVYLNYHMKSHQYQVRLEDIFGVGNTVSEGSFFIVKFWKCDICDLYFNNSQDPIAHHMKTHNA